MPIFQFQHLSLFKNLLPVMTTEATSITRSFLHRSTEQTDHLEIIMLTFECRLAFLHPAEKQMNVSVHRKKKRVKFLTHLLENIDIV